MIWKRAANDGLSDIPDDSQKDTFKYAHGTVMILAWIVFASTAVLFARYGRTIRFGSKDKLLGEKIWFQVHRLIACLTTVLTLLGFFFILVEAGGTWTEPGDRYPQFPHSVLGGIIVCCALLQAWMALFRCHTDSSFRVIFNWLHRITGILAFLLSVPTIFLIIAFEDSNRAGMIVILSLWSFWVILIVIVLEIIRFLVRKSSSNEVHKNNRAEIYDLNGPPIPSINRDEENDVTVWNNRILILFFVHFIISVALTIPLIILLWQ